MSTLPVTFYAAIVLFFTTGEVSVEQSLFTYPEGLSAENFSHPDHTPDFLDEVLANVDPQTRELCKGNAECIFDVFQTGNEEIEMATLQFDNNTRQSQMEASKYYYVSINMQRCAHTDMILTYGDL